MLQPNPRVVKVGSRSRFTENKKVLSQFTKKKDKMKITVHGELNIYFSFHGKQFAKSRFTATMKITIHEEKIAISHFTGKKKGRSRVTKIPLTTLFVRFVKFLTVCKEEFTVRRLHVISDT